MITRPNFMNPHLLSSFQGNVSPMNRISIGQTLDQQGISKQRLSSQFIMNSLQQNINQYRDNLTQFQSYIQACIHKNTNIKQRCSKNILTNIVGLKNKFKQFANEWKNELPHVCRQFIEIVHKIVLLYQQQIQRLLQINEKLQFSYQHLLKATTNGNVKNSTLHFSASLNNSLNSTNRCNHKEYSHQVDDNKNKYSCLNISFNSKKQQNELKNKKQLNNMVKNNGKTQMRRDSSKNSIRNSKKCSASQIRSSKKQKTQAQAQIQSQGFQNTPQREVKLRQEACHQFKQHREQQRQQAHSDKNQFTKMLKIADQILRIKDCEISLMREQITELFEEEDVTSSNDTALQRIQQSQNNHQNSHNKFNIKNNKHNSTNHNGDLKNANQNFKNYNNNGANEKLNPVNKNVNKILTTINLNKQQSRNISEVQQFRLKTTSDDISLNPNVDNNIINTNKNGSSLQQKSQNYSQMIKNDANNQKNSNCCSNKNSENNSRKNSFVFKQQFWQSLQSNILNAQKSNNNISQNSCGNTIKFNKSVHQFSKQKQNMDGRISKERQTVQYKNCEKQEVKEKTGASKLQDLKRNLYKNRTHNECRF